MAIVQPFIKEKLMCGLLYSDRHLVNTKVLAPLTAAFGKLDYQGEEQLFSYSSYYNDEIGSSSIKRLFIAFKELVDPSCLAYIKTQTNALEQQWAVDGKRPVNLDPGLISLGRLLLATTKNAGHRFALANGIYGELTLFYSRKQFNSLPWTYPDFASQAVKQEMLAIRTLYHQQLQLMQSN